MTTDDALEELVEVRARLILLDAFIHPGERECDRRCSIYHTAIQAVTLLGESMGVSPANLYELAEANNRIREEFS